MNTYVPHLFNESLLKSLDWKDISSIISQNMIFDKSVERYLAHPEARDLPEILLSYENLSRFCRILDSQDNFDLSSIFNKLTSSLNLESTLQRLAKSGLLEIEELVAITQIIHFFKLLPKELCALFLGTTDYSDHRKNIAVLDRVLLKKILPLLDDNQKVDWSNHPQLQHLYRELANLDSEVIKYLKEFLRRPDVVDKLQFDSWDILFDHYVVPIRIDAYSHQLGQIIGRSQAGHTFFVEPN